MRKEHTGLEPHLDLDRTVRMLDMFGNREGGALGGFAALVDYTIGRKLAILDYGFLGLVPGEAQVGDLVLWVEDENLYLLLRPEQESDVAATSLRGQERSQGWEDKQHVTAARYIGDSYVHEFKLKRRKDESFGEQEFRLW